MSDKVSNKNGCTDCKFLLRQEEACVEPHQPLGSDGLLHLINWKKANPCILWDEAK